MVRLHDIDPKRLADEMHDDVLGRVMTLTQHLGCIDPSPVLAAIASGGGPSNVRLTVHQLAHYARTGEPPEGRQELVPEYLQTLVDLDLVPDAEALSATREPWDPIEVVVLACLGREALAQRRPLTHAQLAALGGVATSRVRQLVAEGELRKVESGISSTDARRWLEVRKAL